MATLTELLETPPLKIAIVGCGAITQGCHLPAALRSPLVQLIALVDANRQTLEATSRRHALGCRLASTLEEVADGVEAILVATPNHTHAAITRAALNHGLSVLVEKPLTIKYSDAVEVCELADARLAVVSVGYKSRQYPAVKMLRHLLETRYFGEVLGFHHESGAASGWAPLSGYNASLQTAGGGVLIGTGTHFLDRMLYWFGEPQSFRYADDSFGGVEANCCAEFFYDNESGRFSGTMQLSTVVNLKNRLVVDTSEAILELSENETESVRVFPRNNPGVQIEVFPAGHPGSAKLDYFQVQLEEFALAVRRKTKVTVDHWSAARSVKLVEAMYRDRTQLAEPWLLYRDKASA
jgi:predicted dehydrogenase